MITLVDINASQTIQNILQNIQRATLRTGLDYAKDKAGEIVGNVIMGYLKSALPGVPDLTNAIQAGKGRWLENLIMKGVCDIIGASQTQWLNSLWIEVPILRDGTPVGNGFSCGALPGTPDSNELLENYKGARLRYDPFGRRFNANKADFLFKNGLPTENGGSKSWLIGDIKISLDEMHRLYTETNKKKQFDAIANYAKNRKRSHAPITMFIVGKDGPQSKKNELQSKAIRKGVVMLLISIF
ncbi:hypothetical protein [Scytonema sp. NUACC26]|uniref:hypothetical protein n=1 Tax=Scytonema sp. NUACC26 TaxID=3140176 RepID=UPI0034DCB19A